MANAMITGTSVPKSVNVLRDRYLSLKNRLGRLSEKSGEMIEGVVTTLEIQAAAFIFGAVQGAWYEPTTPDAKPGLNPFGIPVEAIFGVGLTVGGFMGLGGEKWASHMMNLGNGALAAWTSNLGRGWGYKFRKNQQAKQAGGAVKGESLRDEIASLLE